MRASRGLHQTVRHQSSGRDDRIHDATVDQFSDNQPLFGNRHRASQGHHNKAIFVASHGFEHVGGFADLAPGECGLRHRPHQVINRADAGKIQRLQRNQAVFDGIVELSVDSCAVIVAVLHSVPLLLTRKDYFTRA